MTLTDADDRKLEPTSIYGSPADPNEPERREYQDYDHLAYEPVMLQVKGQREGIYNLEIILKGQQTLILESLDTDAGIVDKIRHDDNVVSITFDAKQPRTGDFAFAYLDHYLGNYKGLHLFKLPVLPGATVTFTVDWQALRENRPSLTIAVDTDGDGAPERSAAFKRQADFRGPEQLITLTPDMSEYVELFGTETTK